MGLLTKHSKNIQTQNIKKLVTKEDSTHSHKILGILCLLNFIYQFYHLFRYGKMNLEFSPDTPIIILLHGILSLSSFIFHVPRNRHKGLPMIYQEFRLHSIIFAWRSVLCVIGFYYQLDLLFHIVIINLTMILADLVTRKYKAATKTMRGMPFGNHISESIQKQVTKMHSNQQFNATLYMITNIDGACSPLLAIQLAACLMTLVRKSIIPAIDWHRIYALSLWINVFVYWSFDSIKLPIYIIIGSFLFSYFRIDRRHNKYLVWNSIFVVIYLIESIWDSNWEIEPYKMKIINNLVISIYLYRNYQITKSIF